MTRGSARRRAIVALVVVVGACKPGGSTGTKITSKPPAGVRLTDPQALLTGIAGFEAAFKSPAVRSVTGLAAMVSVPAAAPLGGVAECGGGATAAGPLLSPLGVFPDSDLGRILVFDSATGKFQIGADSGGPAGGVEFVLPAVDSLNRVRFPLQSTGTLDLFDVTPPGGLLTLHSVVAGAGSAADYTFVDSGTATAYAGMLTGKVSGGGRSYSFRDSTTGLYLQVTAGATLTDSASGARMTLTATRTATDPFDSYYNLDFTFFSSAQAVRLLGSITTYCLLPSIGLTVSVNDTDYAVVNQGQSGPVVTALDSALTPAQDSAIQALIRGQGEMFSWLTALAQPAKQFLGP